MLITSFKTDADAIRQPYSLPGPVLDRGVPDAAHVGPAADLPLAAGTASLAATLQTVLILVTASMGAYALARLDFPGKKVVFGAIIATLLVPPVVFLIPNYLIVQNLGWLDTIWAITVPGAAGAFGIFFLRQFFIGLPPEIEEAARIDGAGDIRIFLQVVLPLARPALATLAVLSLPRQLERLPVAGLRAAQPGEPDAAAGPGAAAGRVLDALRDRDGRCGHRLRAGADPLRLRPAADRRVAWRDRRSRGEPLDGEGRGAVGVRAACLAARTGGLRARAAPAARVRRRRLARLRRSTRTSPTRTSLEADGAYVAFATNTPAVNVQVGDVGRPRGVGGVAGGRACPSCPRGRASGRTWAPDVSAARRAAATSCTSRPRTPSPTSSASASRRPTSRPARTFTVEGEPLVCPLDEGGAIDAPSSRTTTERGTCSGRTTATAAAMDTWIELAPLTADGTALAGPPTQLFQQTEPWEGQPRRGARHGQARRRRTYVFYSANDYGSMELRHRRRVRARDHRPLHEAAGAAAVIGSPPRAATSARAVRTCCPRRTAM